MTVREYSLKCVKLSRNVTFLVYKRRDEMSMFLTRINGYLEEECISMMIHDNMDLSRLMVYVQQEEDNQKKRCVCDATRPKPQDQVGPSNGGK